MTNKAPKYFDDADRCAEYVIEKVGKEVVLGMCLGLGKPNNFANAIFRKAKEDPNLKLRILTALSLEKPTWSSDLERRFLEHLYHSGRRLPDYAQPHLADYPSRPDFYYEAARACVCFPIRCGDPCTTGSDCDASCLHCCNQLSN